MGMMENNKLDHSEGQTTLDLHFDYKYEIIMFCIYIRIYLKSLLKLFIGTNMERDLLLMTLLMLQ